MPVVQQAKVPVVMLNISPEAAIDYSSFNKMNDRTRMTGESRGTHRFQNKKAQCIAGMEVVQVC